MGDEESKAKDPVRLASQEVSNEFKTLVDSHDLDSLKQLQNLMKTKEEVAEMILMLVQDSLGRLQDSNAVLSHFNEYSEQCFSEVSSDMSKNTRLLKSMKSDLDYIFQKLRSMKTKIIATYPDAFPDDSATRALDRRPDLEMPQ